MDPLTIVKQEVDRMDVKIEVHTEETEEVQQMIRYEIDNYNNSSGQMILFGNISERSELTSLKQIPSDRNPHQCSYYSKTFKYKSKLDSHKITHEIQMLNNCSQCNKVFTRKGALLLHSKFHTGEKFH